MNAVGNPKRFDLVHVRELEQLLAHGQINSRTALIDVASGSLLLRGKGNEITKQIEDTNLVAFARSVFASHRSSETALDQVSALCSAMGGISAVTILMEEFSLFVGRLSTSSRVLSLVVRHGKSSAAASETIVHARAIRTRLAPRKGGDHRFDIEHRVARSYSIWNTLIKVLSLGLAGSGESGTNSAPFPKGLMQQTIADDELVVAGDLFDLSTAAHLDHYRSPQDGGLGAVDSRAAAKMLSALFNGRLDVPAILRHLGFADAAYGKVQIQVGQLDFYWLRVPFFPAMHIPFDGDTALLLYKEPRQNPSLDWAALDQTGLNLLRLRVGELLVSGLKTEMFPFPRTQIEFQGIVERLAELPDNDLLGRLEIGGFAAHPVEVEEMTQRCQECIYYLPHRKWCDLPELPVPVEATWWCRLWKL